MRMNVQFRQVQEWTAAMKLLKSSCGRQDARDRQRYQAPGCAAGAQRPPVGNLGRDPHRQFQQRQL